MEHLTKQQLILLALLVTFVSSTVTGITVVSLTAQDPKGVTQTINRVVERTIEKVSDSNNASVVVPTKEVTVVVKEEQFVTKAVQNAHDSIIRIKNKRDGALLGIGVVIDNKGTIVADRNSIISSREYSGVYQGVVYDLVIDKQDKKSNLITFKFRDIFPPSIQPASFGSDNDIKAGQSIIAVSGADRDVVSIGIISSLLNDNTEQKKLIEIDTTISQDSLLSGTPFLNLDGNIVALKIGKDANGNDILMPISRVIEGIASLAVTQ